MSENPYVGRTILSRDSEKKGTVTNAYQRCRLEGCSGVRLSTKWEDGKRTFPCSKGVGELPDGRLKIL